MICRPAFYIMTSQDIDSIVVLFLPFDYNIDM